MKILFLAPQPFFQERGTPIAVRLAIKVLAERLHCDDADRSDQIDLLTYSEGSDVEIPGVNIVRIKAPGFLTGVGPGISCKKLFCDVIFTFTALKLVLTAKKNRYDLVHAVEESVFIACLIKLLFGIPYIYDMDSSMSLQITEKWPLLKPFSRVLEFCEKIAVKFSMAVVPVCDALAAIADKHGSTDTHILRDVSLVEEKAHGNCRLKEEAGIGNADLAVTYVGNLEYYQGIDLLLESFKPAAEKFPQAHLVIIGGREKHIEVYSKKACSLGIEDNVHFLGPRPVSLLGEYLLQSDILVSPRIKGNNTPMKIYSYLHSGVPIVATNLSTHTQVLSKKVALLPSPSVDEFSEALMELISDGSLRQRIGSAARALAEERYTFSVFKARLNELYDRVSSKILPAATQRVN